MGQQVLTLVCIGKGLAKTIIHYAFGAIKNWKSRLFMNVVYVFISFHLLAVLGANSQWGFSELN